MMSIMLGYSSTAHRVLDIPEIVEQILSYLDISEKISVATVCKRWVDIALNSAWRRVGGILPLVGGLVPLTFQHPRYYNFQRRLHAADWERFRERALRVRSLTYGSDSLTVNNDPVNYDLLACAFDEIARNRPPLSVLPALLPNLQELTWLPVERNRSEYSLMFMHEKVKKLTVRLLRDDVYPIPSLLEDIRLRTPFLTFLELRNKFPVSHIEDNLTRLLSSLTKLQTVIFSAFSVTSKIMESLSKLPQLGTVQFEYNELSEEMGDPTDVIPFSPQLENGSFPALWDLSFSATMQDATDFLTSNHAPSNLTHLYVHVLDAASPTELSTFLTAVMENYPLLAELYIVQTQYPAYPRQTTAPVGDGPTWETLKPILDCPNLVTFELHWDRPLKLTQENIEELASKWPSLKNLSLNCDPFFASEGSTLTMNALVPFARHCPNLQTLGLYVSVREDDLEALSGPVTPFKSLTELNFGLSKITDPNPAVVYLSQLCPLTCEITSGVLWPPALSTLEDVPVDTAQNWNSCWEEVSKLLPLVIRVRMQERMNKDMRDKEVASLRERVVSLTSKEGHEKLEDRDLNRSSCVIA